MQREAKANVTPVRQRTQFTCMSTSMMMCLQANGMDCTEDEVNRVMGAKPMKGARWEEALACAQHYGMRATLTVPATVKQLKAWTDQGIPVMIAWNPEGRDWSHASVVFDVDDEMNVHVADPNIPDPEETVRIVPKAEFYKKWFEKWPDYLVRRPALAIEREITPEGRQVMAAYRYRDMSKDRGKSWSREKNVGLDPRDEYGQGYTPPAKKLNVPPDVRKDSVRLDLLLRGVVKNPQEWKEVADFHRNTQMTAPQLEKVRALIDKYRREIAEIPDKIVYEVNRYGDPNKPFDVFNPNDEIRRWAEKHFNVRDSTNRGYPVLELGLKKASLRSKSTSEVDFHYTKAHEHALEDLVTRNPTDQSLKDMLTIVNRNGNLTSAQMASAQRAFEEAGMTEKAKLFDPKSKQAKKIQQVWVVSDPTEHSEFIDIVYRTNTDELGQYAAGVGGSTWRHDHYMLHDDPKSAEADAYVRLNKLWKGEIPKWVFSHTGPGSYHRAAIADAYEGNPSGKPIYPNKIDHGYDQPLSGGWDIMKRLQDKLLHEQGSPEREKNPRLAGQNLIEVPLAPPIPSGLIEPYRRLDAVDPEAADAFWFTEKSPAEVWRNYHHPTRFVMAAPHGNAYFVLVPSDEVGKWGAVGWQMVSPPNNPRTADMNELESLERLAKFPKGVSMTVDEVAAVVGPEFKEMNENPPESVVKLREEMENGNKTARNTKDVVHFVEGLIDSGKEWAYEFWGTDEEGQEQMFRVEGDGDGTFSLAVEDPTSYSHWRSLLYKGVGTDIRDFVRAMKPFMLRNVSWNRRHANPLQSLSFMAEDNGEHLDEMLSRFEEGKPADPCENMSEADCAKWKGQNEAHKDQFKGAGFLSREQDETEAHLSPKGNQLFDAFAQGKKVPMAQLRTELEKAAARAGHPEDAHQIAQLMIDGVIPGLSKGAACSCGNPGTCPSCQLEKLATDEQEDEKESRFEEGKPADPTKNMSPEDKAKWKEQTEAHKDQFKGAKRERLTSKTDKEATAGVDLWVAIGTEKQIVGATDDPAGATPRFWNRSASQKVVVFKLANVPVPVAEKLVDMGTRAQQLTNDKAWAFVRKYVVAANKTAAREPEGLYGYTKGTQRDVEGAIKKLERMARGIAKAAYKKDELVAPFLAFHAKRGKSSEAKILVAAMKSLGPKVASVVKEADDVADVLYMYDDICLDDDKARRELVRDLSEVTGAPEMRIEQKLRGRDECLDDPRIRKTIHQWMMRVGSDKDASWGTYGFKAKTATLGLNACASLNIQAGVVAAELHRRRAEHHASITGFLREHSKKARCHYARILNASYPDAGMRLASEAPKSVDEWLSWED